MDLYPLKEKHPHVIKSMTGKHLADFTLEAVVAGDIQADDIRISKEVLILQAEVARQQGKIQLAENFIRASELIAVPDDEILDMYNMLRPYRGTQSDFETLSKKLRQVYQAHVCAELVDETLNVYKKRDLLKMG